MNKPHFYYDLLKSPIFIELTSKNRDKQILENNGPVWLLQWLLATVLIAHFRSSTGLST